MGGARGAASAARRRALEDVPGVRRLMPRDEPVDTAERREWPKKPKTVGRKAKRTRVSCSEAADALERR